MLLVGATKDIQSERMDEAMAKERDTMDRLAGALDGGGPVQAKVVTGAKADAVADKPLLTGDPEWDEIELAETDPFREPLESHWLE